MHGDRSLSPSTPSRREPLPDSTRHIERRLHSQGSSQRRPIPPAPGSRASGHSRNCRQPTATMPGAASPRVVCCLPARCRLSRAPPPAPRQQPAELPSMRARPGWRNSRGRGPCIPAEGGLRRVELCRDGASPPNPASSRASRRRRSRRRRRRTPSRQPGQSRIQRRTNPTSRNRAIWSAISISLTCRICHTGRPKKSCWPQPTASGKD